MQVPLYMVFVLYLVISSNFLAQLFSCRLRHLLDNSMIAKHVAGYMTLLFFVVLSSGMEMSPTEAILNSLVIYVVFWVSTRMSIEYFVVFIVLAFVLYVMELYQREHSSQRLQDAMTVTQTAMAVVLVVGFVFYMVEKMMEYKKKFRLQTFLLGKPECRNKSPSVSHREAFNFLLKSASPTK